jgi:hypothetical protein
MRPSSGFIGCASTTSSLVVMSATRMSHVETGLPVSVDRGSRRNPPTRVRKEHQLRAKASGRL